ncbi:hypothetical protein CIB84_005627 [Bambusicola thoracicus]|uniref:Nucleoside diphosphate kinase n=1 Tax=Bambusicola thoracicus TaxID=9083 RepID=A0A2P4T2N2_BAMTH|nr:hypothetical protein CIB84_005627 [Bambusicola thoracicus]
MAAAACTKRPLQLTLALLKPDAVAHPLVLEDCFSPTGQFFYQRLVEFMARYLLNHMVGSTGCEEGVGGPMWAYILAHENAISLWRSLMGPTKVFRARNCVPDSIRGAYGLTDTRNTTHGSDSPASASREIAFFFPEFNEQLWYQQEEPRLRCGQMYYNAEKRVHCVIRSEETELT